jgi:hypothetical protein
MFFITYAPIVLQTRTQLLVKCAGCRDVCEYLLSQVGTEWRKVAKKLEGEEVFEALDKVDRLEVYQVSVLDCRFHRMKILKHISLYVCVAGHSIVLFNRNQLFSTYHLMYVLPHTKYNIY